jgi:rod shape-determining protein MreB
MAGEELQSSLLAPPVQKALEKLFRQMGIIESVRTPNTPIPGYELPNAEMLAHWRKRLAHATRDEFIGKAEEFLDQVRIPDLEETDRATEHLNISHEVALLREKIIEVGAAAKAAGYSRPPPSFMAQRDEIAPQIAEIKQYLVKMSSKVDALERTTAAKITGNISLSLGIVSIPFESLTTALSEARRIVESTADVDVGVLTSVLTRIATIASDIAGRIAAVARQIPRRIVHAAQEVAKLGIDLARRGTQLFEKFVRTRTPEADERTLSRHRVPDLDGGPPAGREKVELSDKEKVDGDVGIDFGSSSVRICAVGHGLILNQPSLALFAQTTQGQSEIRAVGAAAKDLRGRTPPNYEVVRVMRSCSISDFELAEGVLSHFLDSVHRLRVGRRPLALVSAPSGMLDEDRGRLGRIVLAAGARRVSFVRKGVAAAIGADVDFAGIGGVLVADIGEGGSEVVILSEGRDVFAESIPVGGEIMDEAVVAHVRALHRVLLGDATAETVKKTIGSALLPVGEGAQMRAKGRNLVSGVPKEIALTQAQIAEALQSPLADIAQGIRAASLQAREREGVVANRIVLTGGGALLPGIDTFVRERLGLPTSVAANPQYSTIRGLGRILESMESWQKVLIA